MKVKGVLFIKFVLRTRSHIRAGIDKRRGHSVFSNVEAQQLKH